MISASVMSLATEVLFVGFYFTVNIYYNIDDCENIMYTTMMRKKKIDKLKIRFVSLSRSFVPILVRIWRIQ